MGIDPKLVEPTADVLEIFVQNRCKRAHQDNPVAR